MFKSRAFIERQTPHRITRRAAHVFVRNLKYDGSLKEWNERRKQEEAAERPEKVRKMLEGVRRRGAKERAEGEGRVFDLDYGRPPQPLQYEGLYDEPRGRMYLLLCQYWISK